jgi:hypothetical protein
MVDQRKSSNPGACQGLGTVGTHAAKPCDQHVLVDKPGHLGIGEQDRGAFKLERQSHTLLP